MAKTQRRNRKGAAPRKAKGAVKRRARAAGTRQTAKSRTRATAAKARPAAKKAKKAKKTVARRAKPAKRVAAKAVRKSAKKAAATRRATSAVRRVARVAAPIAKKAAPARKAAAAKPTAPQKPPVAKKAAPKPAAAVAPAKTRKPPALDRERRTVGEAEMVPMPPSSLVPGNASAARSGADELRMKMASHTGSGPVITAGDVDADWGAAEAVGDEAPGGDNPTPDQDVVDEIGRALGVEYDDDEELQGGDEIAGRDRERWELDPASSDDFDER